MNRLVRRWVLLTALCLTGPALSATHPAVIELFTSQGCSSCPPADALLGELAHRNDVIALAFHVDYWDSLGWKDRFELPLAAQRQQRYVETLGLQSAFTPQAVVDGQRSLVGSDRRAIESALQSVPEGVTVNSRLENGNLIIELGNGSQEPFDVSVATLLPEAKSPVNQGENAGKTLTDFNIVLSYVRVGTWHGAPAHFSVPLTALPPQATQAVILIQQSGQREIAGALKVGLR
jgi:hypothetical protein